MDELLLTALVIVWGMFLISCCFEILPPRSWKQIEVTAKDKEMWFQILPTLEGIKYKLGGQSPETGFDCSGLIVYLYSRIGVVWFRYHNKLVKDVSAEALYLYNSRPVTFNELEQGDLIFFDTDNDSHIDHVAIFDCCDENGNVWVWDATDDPDGVKIFAVSRRILRYMWNKNPVFAKPLKVVTE